MSALQILANLILIQLFRAWLCKDRGKVSYLPSTVQEVCDGAQSGAQR